MTVSLQGNSPAALTAGILLLSRARSFGQRLDLEIVGDPLDITAVEGPALVHSAVLASCGIGRAQRSMCGPARRPCRSAPRWRGHRFTIDRGAGGHPAPAHSQMCRETA